MVAVAPCGGPTLPAPVGTPTEAELGLIIQAPAIHGSLPIPGAGLLTTMAAGHSVRELAGGGGRAAAGWDWPTKRLFLPLLASAALRARILRTFPRQPLVCRRP